MSRRLSILLSLILLSSFVCQSCRYTHTGDLPAHIQTIRVPTFKTGKDVFEYGLEARLTKAIIARLAKDPRVKVVNSNEDALLTGIITDVDRSVLREDKSDKASLVRLTITAEISLEDLVEGEFLIEKNIARSSSSSAGAGIYDLDRGQGPSEAETKALDALADDIARRVVSTW